jgi:transcriptional regulator GlxA family with amidase domain
MGHDRLRDGPVAGRSRIGVQYLLALSVRYAVSDSASVYEDSPVRKGREQTAAVCDADGRVQCDRLPNPIDVAFGDAVPLEYRGSQISALDLETSLAGRALTESKIVHDSGGEEQVLVVVRVIQRAVMLGQEAGEEKAADAVIHDRPTHRGAGRCEARIGERPGGEDEEVPHVSRAYGQPGSRNSGPIAEDRYDRAMLSKHAHRVAVLALPAVIPLELGIAAEIFGRDPHYRVTVCAEGRSASLPGSGLTVNTPAGLEGLKPADTVIIPGYEDVDATVSTAVLDAIRAAHARGARLVSICTAAFALAAAGVLDGRPATTHWRWTAELQRRYPNIEVLPNRLFIDDGDILTSAGVTTGIDLCLHLIRRDFGSAAANRRARGLVAPPQRQGGQAQFIERLMPDASGDQLGPLRGWMLENLARPLDLGTLATRAHVSRRTLSRRFREETGVSPMAWLADARIDRAREILETTTEPVENIGRLTGLGAPVSVRAAFHRRIGISPKEYRAVWRGPSFSATDSARAATSSKRTAPRTRTPLVSLRQARPRDGSFARRGSQRP